MKLRAVIVDDEPPARKKLRHFLKNEERIEIVGEATDGLEAVKAIVSLHPDLVFLDIQMPKLNGFEVLESLDPVRPRIIFTTAYDQYALKAFEVHALDYLLKPFEEERFRMAVDRAVEGKSGKEQIDRLIADVQTTSKLRRILIREGEKIKLLKTDEIQRIEAEEKYVRVFTGKESYLLRETMNLLEARLDPESFIRIHRSHIVHFDAIRELQAWSHGDYFVLMKDGARLPIGRSYREKLFRALE